MSLIVVAAATLAAGCASYTERTVVEKPTPVVTPVPAPGSTVVYTAPAS